MLPQNIQTIWSLLADYLFIETSLVRGLLAGTVDAQAQAILADYIGILQLARNYDQQQQALRLQQEEDALAQGEQIEPLDLPPIHEQARGFSGLLKRT